MSAPRSLAQWRDAVVAEFPNVYRYRPRDLKRAQSQIRSLFDYLKACGITDVSEVAADDVGAWIWREVTRRDGSVGPPAPATARTQYNLAKQAFKIVADLGAAVDPRTVTGPPIGGDRREVPPRALTDEELQRVCTATRSRRKTSQKGVLVALSRASATAQQLPLVRAGDVDLDAATVALSGPGARLCALDPDSVSVIAEYLEANSPAADELLCVRADTAPERAAHSVSARIHNILRAAGLSDRRDITARSIRLTEAQRVLRHKGIAAAARFLGASLDATAEMLDYQWRQSTAVPGEEPGDG